MVTGAPPIIEASEVSVSIDGHALLEPISLSVSRGEVVALTGPNGSGKTTLLRVLAGLVPVTQGTARVAGRAPSERDPRMRADIAALIGVPPLARNLTLREHLQLVAVSWGSAAATASEEASAILDTFGIGHLELRFPHELSSGQQQLFALCLTLIRPATALLLDEPEQRLDASRRERLAAVILERATGGTAVVLATHSTELLAATGARAVTLDGRPT